MSGDWKSASQRTKHSQAGVLVAFKITPNPITERKEGEGQVTDGIAFLQEVGMNCVFVCHTDGYSVKNRPVSKSIPFLAYLVAIVVY